MNDLSLLTIIVICLIFGAITAAIGQKKNLRVGQWFVVGALLGIIGVVIVILQPTLLPKAPPGMRAVKCPRCNTVQNIPETQPEYVCWQCKAAHRLWETAPQSITPSAPDAPQKLAPGQFTTVRCDNCRHVQAVPLSQPTLVCEQCNTKLG